MNELERLRRANPVPSEDVANLSSSARARAAFEEITMPTEQTAPTTPARRRGPILAGAGAVVLAAIALVVALTAGSGSEDPEIADGDPGSGDAPPVSAMCVETYSLDTLPNREFAFAGTVTAIEGDRLTFSVDEAFRGDAGDEVSLGGAVGLTSITPDNQTVVSVGDRLLVAGDDDFAWGCGFTQPYDADVAAEWRSTLGG